MSTIFVESYDPADLVPRAIVNLVDGRGLRGAEEEPRRVCLLGVSLFPEVSGEPLAPANVPVRVRSERPGEAGGAADSATELFGAGSELHLMCRAAFRAYPGVELWAVPLTAPSRTGRAQASLTARGVARRTGEWTIVLHNEPVRVRIEEGTTAEQALRAVALALREAVDAERGLPIQPPDVELWAEITESEGQPGVWDLAVIAAWEGETGNDLGLERRGEVPGIGLAVTGFSGGGGATDLGESGEGGDGALKAIEAERFHYLAVANTDSGEGENLQALRDHLESLAGPIPGLRQQGTYGAVGLLEDAVGSLVGKTGTAWLNSARLQCVWSRGSGLMPGELAAAMAAHRAWMEGMFPAANLCGQVVAGVPRPRLPFHLPDRGALNQALGSGVTPLDMRGTQMVVVRSVTTRSVGTGPVPQDTIKVTVTDFVADDLAWRLDRRYRGFKLAPDSDAPVPGRTATPATVRRSLTEWLREHQAAGLLRQVEAHLPEVRVELDAEAPGRLAFEIPEEVVDLCVVTAGNLVRL